MNRQTFGRRNSPHSEARTTAIDARAEDRAFESSFEERPAPVSNAAFPSGDEELRAWKEARRSKFPLQQVALMASLSFGIASFVLPDAVNDRIEWPLYALCGASLYVGLSKRFRKADAKPRAVASSDPVREGAAGDLQRRPTK